jgi:hypothetical protein
VIQRGRLGALLAFVVTALLVLPGGAHAADRAAWSVTDIPYPTNFASGSEGSIEGESIVVGPAYHITAVNVGGAATSEPFTVTDTLPASVSPILPQGAVGQFGFTGAQHPLSCSKAGQVVTCTGSGDKIYPGENLEVAIPVKVKSGGPKSYADAVTVSGGGAAAMSASGQNVVSPTPAQFGLLPGRAGLFASMTAPDGSVVTSAAGHPSELNVGFGFPTELEPGNPRTFTAGGGVKDIRTVLPPGVVVNPMATPKCREIELESGTEVTCPGATQVGVVNLTPATGGSPVTTQVPVFNMVAPGGSPGVFGMEIAGGVYVHLVGAVRSDGAYELSANVGDILAKVPVVAAQVSLWGDPESPSHDALRGLCSATLGRKREFPCPSSGGSGKAFLTMPSACSGPIEVHAEVDSWLTPGTFVERAVQTTDLEGNPVGVEGCNAVGFEPTISSTATTNQGDTPSGLEFDLHQVQREGFEERATASLKNATVTLPEGLVLNPSAANGREACSSSQIGLMTPIGQAPIHFAETPQSCPNSSKLGTSEVMTPLLDHPLQGSVFLAKPFDNPFDSLLGIYLVVEDQQTGIIAKLAGKVSTDPVTGRLATTFEESPQLPLEDVKLSLFDGARAALTTPLTCGTHTTTSTLTPWSTPEGADAHPEASFQTSGGCYGSEGQAPRSYSFTAGTESPLSGSYSPFILRLSRPDGSQHITGIQTTLPEGLLGKLAGVSYCPESGIFQAISREHPEQGRLEQNSPSCPSSSEVGTVNVTAGSGVSPVAVSGHAYLAGPYKGAPLSLVVIVPAVTGPFDLGTVVDRVALNVGEYDARIHAVADPLPTIREGIPLDVRSIELKLDRSGFTLNPTSCEAKAIEGSVSTQPGQSASLNNRFQVGECGRLAFKPKLKLELKGATKRLGLPAVKATVTYPKGGSFANIAKAQVSLPGSELLEQGNLNKTCTKPVVQAGACPASSIYGKAKAWSPLLEKPLEGPVYLVGGYGYKLPALVAELNGQIRLLLVGKVDTGKNGGIRNTFEAVPDAPVEKFVLELKGGKKYGLLINSKNLCTESKKANVAFSGQNGRVENSSITVDNSCKKAKKQKGKKKNHKKGAKGTGHKGKKSGNNGHNSSDKKKH